jgi:hypothetical protein
MDSFHASMGVVRFAVVAVVNQVIAEGSTSVRASTVDPPHLPNGAVVCMHADAKKGAEIGGWAHHVLAYRRFWQRATVTMRGARR